MKNVVKAIVFICLGVFGIQPVWAGCPAGDLNGDCKVDIADFALLAQNWLAEGIPTPILNGVTLISINDSGAGMKDINGNPINHGGFTGYMSKYLTTNAQYCQFLNDALASDDIAVTGNDVIGNSGTNSGADFVGEVYYNLAGAGATQYGATNGGAARIHYNGGAFTVDSGFENHPVTYVNWYGSTAFCNYYGYRLPTEWEWQAVADYDGSYTYGCGATINNSMANYIDSTHPDGTTVVGAFGAYGYGMCDMAGNVWEWTSSLYDTNYTYRACRGGDWGHDWTYLPVAFRNGYTLSNRYYYVGFRLVLNFQ